MRLVHSLLSAMCIMLIGTSLSAQQTNADGEFSLQGRLTSGTSNQAVADGQYSLTINIYEAGTNTVVATETDMVNTVDGIFSTMIGDDSNLSVEADTDYEVGISIDGGSELTPRIMIGDAISALTADVAASANVATRAMTALNADSVGGFAVSTNGGANAIVTTDAQGRINPNLLGSSLVTSINGETGNVNLNVTGSGVTLDNDGNGNLTLNITGGGGGGGSFELPFSGTADVTGNQSALRLTSTGNGSAATFLNTGEGSALNISSNASGSSALNVTNTAGSAINATATSGSNAALRLQNTSSDANARLISALNAGGNAAFEVMGNGQTMIEATGGSALDLSTDASGDAVISLQNTSADANAQLIAALNASGNTAFEVMGSGETSINASNGSALNLTTDASGDAVISLQNMSADANAQLISALNAGGNAAFEVMGNGQTMINTTGNSALDLTTNASGDAVITLQNTSSDANAQLISALNAGGNAAFEVMGNGQTTINSSVENALDVSTDVSGGTALRVNGGLALPQAAGTGTLNAGSMTTTINNALVNSNSVVMLTINSATNITNGLRISNVGDGTFTVSLLDTTLGALAGNVTFNYLIINQ